MQHMLIGYNLNMVENTMFVDSLKKQKKQFAKNENRKSLIMANNQILDDQNTFPPEKKRYRGKLAGLAWKVEQAESRIKIAGKFLYLLAAFNLIPIIPDIFNKSFDVFIVLPTLIIVIVFIGCAFLSKKNPVLAFALALVFYWALLVLEYMIMPESFFRGSLWKFIFSIALLIGLFNAIHGINLKKKLEKEALKQESEG